ncbi:MAG TPA: hypothetical protein VGJ40_02430 [Gaiellaceae bacterium]|jgi:hypothetical protein
MKRLVPVAVMAAAVLLLAAPAPAQPAAAPTNRQLALQIKALQKEVKTLKKQVRDARAIALGSVVYTGCSIAVTADAFQGTWTVIDQVAGRPIFGPQVPVSDSPGLCSAFEIRRAPNQVPPNVSVFDSLLQIFRG